MKSSYYLSFLAGIARSFRGVYDFERKPIKWTLTPREKSERNTKDKALKAVQIRRRKAQKLSELSKPKRRAVYYYNLRHAVKMYR